MKIEKLRLILAKSHQLSGSADSSGNFERLDAALKKFDDITVKQLAKKLEVVKD